MPMRVAGRAGSRRERARVQSTPPAPVVRRAPRRPVVSRPPEDDRTTRDALPEAVARHRHHHDPARDGRRRRACHRLRHGLPRLAAVPRPADPAGRRLQGVARVDPPRHRGRHRVHDPGRRVPRLEGPPSPALDPHPVEGRGASQRFTLLAAFSAVATYALLLFGSHVTAQNAALVFPDWPLMNGTILPLGGNLDAQVRPLYEAHVLHRYVAVVVGLITWATAFAAWRTQRRHPTIVRLAVAIAILYPVQALIGGLQVLTHLDEWTQTVHLALGAIIWGLSAALAVTAYYEARVERVAVEGTAGIGGPAGDGGDPTTAPSTRGDTVRAYIALTKPRIIELLLITTIPAMVLATRDIPAMSTAEWFRIAFWTLLCGSLAAGSANSINQYLDRDIDLLMSRTRKRPLPAHSVAPESAVVFGIVLGVISIALMAY